MKLQISCGAAALATLLTYHVDDPVSEQSVAEGSLRHTEASKVLRRGGFSLLDRAPRPSPRFERVWKLKVPLVVRPPGGTTPSFASPAGFTGRLAP